MKASRLGQRALCLNVREQQTRTLRVLLIFEPVVRVAKLTLLNDPFQLCEAAFGFVVAGTVQVCPLRAGVRRESYAGLSVEETCLAPTVSVNAKPGESVHRKWSGAGHPGKKKGLTWPLRNCRSTHTAPHLRAYPRRPTQPSTAGPQTRTRLDN